MNSILLAAPTPIGQQQTGPAIRYVELARVLSTEQRVTLLLADDNSFSHPSFAVCTRSQADLGALLATHQIVVVQGPAIQRHPRLAQVLVAGEHFLVVDLYDPITLELLEIDAGGGADRWMYLESVAVLNEQLKLGDFFLCANERQRHYWLGALSALGRVNQDTYDGGELRHLIDVVPFGLPAERPRSEGLVLKGILPGIDADDRILLWGGGLWDWLDPLTPIRAMERVAACHPTARLIFFESGQYQPAMLGKAKGLAEELGLLDRHVLFADWLPPEEWESCLLEADVGLSFHPASIEACFAFRTRLLDYLWAGLPIVAAAGDVLSDVVVTHGLGYVVEPGHSDALSKALIALLDEPDARQRRGAAFRQASEQFLWERVAEPLLRYCRQPWHAGDRDRNFYDRWYTAHQDHIVAQTAHAERRLAEAKTEAARQNGQLQAQIDDLTLRLQWSEERFEAAMSGRVMRAMTSAQQAFRRLRGCKP